MNSTSKPAPFVSEDKVFQSLIKTTSIPKRDTRCMLCFELIAVDDGGFSYSDEIDPRQGVPLMHLPYSDWSKNILDHPSYELVLRATLLEVPISAVRNRTILPARAITGIYA